MNPRTNSTVLIDSLKERGGDRDFDPRTVAATEHASELIARVPRDQPFDAAKVLEDNPELLGFESVVVDLAYEQYCREIEAGRPVDLSEFISAFPKHRQPLLEMLQLHRILDADAILTKAGVRHWPKAGETHSGFELLEQLGQGAFSRVFLASESQVGDRCVVVKVCVLGEGEAHSLGKLQHPQIIRVLSAQHDQRGELTAICMPYLGRTTLLDVVQQAFKQGIPLRGAAIMDIVSSRNGMDARIEAEDEHEQSAAWIKQVGYVDAAAELCRQVAEALAYTHRRGYCHCDVKPSNVLITGAGRAKLFDFNLAAQTRFTDETVRGTLAYMAPEQLWSIVAGELFQVDRPCDVFAFGSAVYQLLCGQLPFGEPPEQPTRTRVAGALLRRQAAGFTPLRSVNANVDPALAQIVEQCLAIRPAERPASMEIVAEQLGRRHTLPARTSRWLHSRRKFLITGAALTTCGVVGTGIGYRWTDWERWGHAAAANERFGRAAQYYSAGIQFDPGNPNLWFWRGRALCSTGKFNAAVRDFEQAEKLLQEVQQANAQTMAERQNWKDGRLSACLAHATASVASENKIRTLDLPAQQRSFFSDEILGLFRWAISRYREAIRLGTITAAIYSNLGQCFSEVGKHKEARIHLEMAVDHADAPPAAWFRLAVYDFEASMAGDDDRGLEHLQAAAIKIRRAIEGGADGPSAFYTAASIHARRCQLLGAGDSAADFRFVLEYGRRAIASGMPPENLGQLATFCPRIAKSPEFAELQAGSVGRVEEPQSHRFADPLRRMQQPIDLLKQPI